MKIAIYGQRYNKKTKASVNILLDLLSNKKIEFFIEKKFLVLIAQNNSKANYNHFETLNKSFDLLISIGGDGTILRAITLVKDLNIPLVGINAGRLGFLATIQTDKIADALLQILNKKFNISERSLLSIQTTPNTKEFSVLNFALNEIAISRKNTTSMITVKTKLDDEYLTSYWSDGLIVSTPTGSTGYSLSCGGPVITPNAKNFVLTPIAPHNLNARPLVIPDTTTIQLEVKGREDSFLVSLDSRIATLNEKTTVTIKKAPFTIKLVELQNETFLDTLRKKLLWGEDKRN